MVLNCLFRDKLQFLVLTMLLGFVVVIVASVFYPVGNMIVVLHLQKELAASNSGNRLLEVPSSTIIRYSVLIFSQMFLQIRILV